MGLGYFIKMIMLLRIIDFVITHEFRPWSRIQPKQFCDLRYQEIETDRCKLSLDELSVSAKADLYQPIHGDNHYAMINIKCPMSDVQCRIRRDGFSLTEVLLAVGILAVGMLFIASVFPVSIYFTTVATERTIAPSSPTRPSQR